MKKTKLSNVGTVLLNTETDDLASYLRVFSGLPLGLCASAPVLAKTALKRTPAQPNGFVFHTVDKRYPEVLASCPKNLLAGLGC